ncbi:hypothetical protein C4F51_16490 [Cellvibrio sp. KB43]|uniref:Uncharacterized protein n=1 Tax=Cellvibrio polysaccharolyticus TaxID=2082724 RepID=A0A928VA18_9GAMM|nr:hypothetical protein [Cellvibrio polysaccharolyticus]
MAVLNSASLIKNWRQLNSNNFYFLHPLFLLHRPSIIFYFRKKFCALKNTLKSVRYFFKKINNQTGKNVSSYFPLLKNLFSFC